MTKQIRVIEQKRYESIDDFCTRLESNNSKKVQAVGIYNGVALYNKNKEENICHYISKTLKLVKIKTEE